MIIFSHNELTLGLDSLPWTVIADTVNRTIRIFVL